MTIVSNWESMMVVITAIIVIGFIFEVVHK